MKGPDRLEAIEDIKKLKARYFRGVDFTDYAILRDVFHDDVTVDYRGSTTDPLTGKTYTDGTDAPYHGGEASARMICATLANIVSVHHGHMPEIELTSDDTATGIWPMEDRLYMPEGSPIRLLVGYGHYHETYERVDGAWKIRTLRLTRLKVDVFSQ